MVEQLQAPGIQYRQEAKVKLAAIQLRRFIANPVHLEALARPFASISVTSDGRAAVCLQRASKLSNGRLWAEGSFALK
jgi:hypothetical protein